MYIEYINTDDASAVQVFDILNYIDQRLITIK